MTASAHADERPLAAGRVAAALRALRAETAVTRIAIAAAALHVADDN